MEAGLYRESGSGSESEGWDDIEIVREEPIIVVRVSLVTDG